MEKVWRFFVPITGRMRLTKQGVECASKRQIVSGIEL
jgi:hypothetical protein